MRQVRRAGLLAFLAAFLLLEGRQPVHTQAAGPTVLLVVNSASPNVFGGYLAEILRAEGIGDFATVDLSTLTATTLSNAKLAILAETPLTAAQSSLFVNYVATGGRLIAMRPDAQLAGTLGITPQAGTTPNGYISINQSGPGAGLQSLTLPFKGTAAHYQLLSGATSAATLYSNSTTSTGLPAVVRYGRTATWAFDLARSTAYTRQGDPALSGVDRDGQPALRTSDVFYNDIDRQRVPVPHADVQMRLFSRVVASLLSDAMPLPQLWYFPGTARTVLVVTGDTHVSTQQSYTDFLSAVEARGGRASIYVSRWISYPTPSVAQAWRTAGHEVGMHPFGYESGQSLEQGYVEAESYFTFSGLAPHSPTVRNHYVEWLGWVDGAKVEANHGIRMDTSFYTFGPAVVNPDGSQAHGFINGTGLPMRFVDETGALVPVFQQTTQLIDEQLLIGPYQEFLTTAQALQVSSQMIDDSQAGGYSALATQFHIESYPDANVRPWVDGTLDYAASRGIPLWPTDRWLRFNEARIATQISNPVWSSTGKRLTFNVTVPSGAEPVSLTLPSSFAGDGITVVTIDGQIVTPTTQTINGQSRSFITVAPGTGGSSRAIFVRYGNAPQPPPSIAITDVSVTEGNSGVTPATLTVTLSEPASGVVTIAYQTQALTAQAGADFTSASGTLTFPANTNTQQIVVNVLGDTIDEPDETFAVVLSNPQGAEFGDSTGIVTILDDDLPPNVPPVANPDTATTVRNEAVTIAVLNNDTDSNGDPLTVTTVGTASAGTAVVVGGTTVTYTPNSGYCGSDSFTYSISDGRGGTASSTVSVTVECSGASVTHTTIADFTSCGTTGLVDTRAVTVGDGAIQLAGIVDDEYTTAPLSSQWVPGTWSGAPFNPVPSGGTLTLGDAGGAYFVRSAAAVGVQALEARAQFTAAPWEQIGYGALNYAGNQYFLIGTFNGSTSLYARSNRGTGEQITNLGAIPSGFHVYRIERLTETATTDRIRYLIDGAVVAQHVVGTLSPTLYVYQEAGGQTLPSLVVDRIAAAPPYAASGSYTSCAIDAGQSATWTTLRWTATVPAGTSLTASTRTSVDGTTWSAWSAPISVSGGGITSPAGRYLQYRLDLGAGSGSATPVVENVTVTREAPPGPPNTPPVANPDSATTLRNQPVSIAVLSNDTDADGNPLSVTTVGSAGAGTVAIVGGTSVTYTPNTGYCGSDSFTYGISDGQGGTATGSVSVTVACAGTTVTHTTIADFTSCGTTGLVGTRAVSVGDGAIQLAGILEDEYTTAPLGSQWVPGTWSGAPFNPAPSGGLLTLGGSGGAYFVRSAAAVGVQVLEARAQFTAAPWEQIGYGSLNYAGNQYLLISTFNGSTSLYARSNVGSGEQATNLGAIPTGFHDYRIERLTESPTTDRIRYLIDGAVVAQHVVPTVPATLYVYQEAGGQTLPALVIDRIVVSPPYTANGSYTSCAIDGGLTGNWTTISWTATLPAGTSLTASTRTSADGTTWSAWSGPLSISGSAITSPNNRYLQYRLDLASTNGSATPVVDAVSLNRQSGGNTPPVANADSASTVRNEPVTIAVLGNDTDADGDTLSVTTVGSAGAGTAAIAGGTSVTYTPNAGYCGSDSFSYSISDGHGGTATATVSVTVACTGTSLTHTTIADFTSCGTTGLVGTRVVNVGDGAIQLAGALEDEYAAAPLGTQWVAGAWSGAPFNPAPSGGVLTLGDAGGAYFVRSASAVAVHALEARVQFTAAPWEQIGYGALDYAGNQYLLLSTFTGSTNLYARSNLGSGEQTTDLGAIPTGFHDYRIERLTESATTDRIRYLVDGVVAAEHVVPTVPAALHVYQEAGGQTLPSLVIDRIVAAPPYAASGSYTSCTVDAGHSTTWTTLRWTATVPAGTSLTASTRTSGDGATWTGWSAPMSVSGSPIASPAGRYLQYRLDLATGNGSVTPQIDAVTINENGQAGATPSLSIASASATEGDSGTTPMTFTVSVSQSSSSTITATYATAPGTAAAGVDYVTTSGTLTIPPGTTTATISVPIIGDTLDEADETLSVSLGSPTNATIGSGTAVGTILDDDAPPGISIAGASITEGNSGTVNMSFPVALSAASGRTVTVAYATANGTAAAGSDYTATSGTLTFAPGVTTGAILVPIIGDTIDEATETFTVTLSAPVNATISTGTATGTIIDNDTRSLSINSVSVTEGNTGSVNATFTVTLSASSSQTITVGYATANGTATAGSDYTATSGTLTFTPGALTRTLTVAVLGDVLDEADETFSVVLSNPVNATIATGTGTGTIIDNDPTPSLSINNVTVTEGNTGSVNATFTVTLSAASGRTVTVAYATANGTATAGADYTAASGTLTFAAGVTTQQISIAVLGDLLDEPTETFTVTLSAPVNATIGTATGTGTITDNDPAPSLSINSVSVTEGNTGSVNATFTVTLSAASGRTVSVNYATANGTATAGSDYTSRSGTLTFSPGVTTQQVAISVLGDTLNEANETFTVGLSGAVNATIAVATGTGTIIDDDPTSLSINDVSITEGNSGTINATFTVTLSVASSQTITVAYATADGTATAGLDYNSTSGTLSFSPGALTRTLNVAVRGDLLDEDNETFFVVLSNPVNATIADGSGTGTIIDNDALPVLSINNVSVNEGNSASVNAVFTVTLSPVSGRTVTVAYATANVTATAGSDYLSRSGTLTFPAGTTTQQVIVPVLGDTVPEPNETFRVNLSGATNATIGTATGTGTIIDNDGG